MALALFLVLCWIAYFGYWIIAGRAAATAETIRASGGSAAWLIAVGAFVGLSARFGYRFAFAHQEARFTGVFCTVAGLVVGVWARHALAANWSKDVALVEGHALVTSGPYRYIRHPIYSGFLLMALGTALIIETAGLFLLFLIFAIFLVVKARREEQLLQSAFPTEYAAYRSRTSTLLPFVY